MNYIDLTVEDEKKPLILQRADPFVYYHTDGYYYFTASTPEYDRIELRRAWSLKALKDAEPLVIWRKHSTGPMSYHIWAPELHFINGKWYIYFAAGRNEDPWWIRTWVLENSSADPFAGTWEEKGQIIPEWDSFMLDMTVFEHKEKLYAVWAQKRKEKTENSALYIAQMENPYTLKGPQTLLTIPEYDWECRGFKVNEGPAILKRNGKIFLTYSASATDASYCMGLLSADENADLLDSASWSKQSEPVLTTDVNAKIFGPGHNSFTTSRDGKTDYLIYHARPYAEVNLDFALYDPNRHTWIKKIEYDTNGFPKFMN
ncbi:MAG: glycoside hydrolase family 43 protein [Treponema sp.]|nr:glycoside hydrolase family 43 protein [Treponema sp.]